MFAFLLAWATWATAVSARRFDVDDVVALQVAQGNPVSGLERVSCGDFLLEDRAQRPIDLQPRQSSAKIIDTFAFGNAYEVEELLLRMYEMGEEVTEFHIVEGDRDFTGAKKPYEFEAILNSGQFDAWKDKITHHKVELPEGAHGYRLQETQRQQMRSQMNDYKDYDPKDILLEGDLDEIVSYKILKVLKHCEPVAGRWNTGIHMGNFMFSLAWTTGEWGGCTTAGFFSEGPAEFMYPTATLSSSESYVKRPHKLGARDGRLLGWHVSWTLNGSKGLAHKIFIHVEGRSKWAEYPDEASLEKFLDGGFYTKVNSYEPTIHPSELSKEDVPQALIQHPEKFPNILRGIKW